MRIPRLTFIWVSLIYTRKILIHKMRPGDYKRCWNPKTGIRSRPYGTWALLITRQIRKNEPLKHWERSPGLNKKKPSFYWEKWNSLENFFFPQLKPSAGNCLFQRMMPKAIPRRRERTIQRLSLLAKFT